MEWLSYDDNKVFKPGKYYFKIIGHKNKIESVDFIPKLFGVELEEFAWWDSNWNRKRRLFVANSEADTIVNMTIAINVTYDSDMQADFDDLRFLDDTETIELDFAFETHFASNSAIVWVRIPSLPNPNQTIYMYYNNSAATNAGNPQNAWDGTFTNVFLFNGTSGTTDFNLKAGINASYIGNNISFSVETGLIDGNVNVTVIDQNVETYVNISHSSDIDFGGNFTICTLYFSVNHTGSGGSTLVYRKTGDNDQNGMAISRAGNHSLSLVMGSRTYNSDLITTNSSWNPICAVRYGDESNTTRLTMNKVLGIEQINNTNVNSVTGLQLFQRDHSINLGSRGRMEYFFISTDAKTSAWVNRTADLSDFTLITFGDEQIFGIEQVVPESGRITNGTNLNFTCTASTGQSSGSINVTNLSIAIHNITQVQFNRTLFNFANDSENETGELIINLTGGAGTWNWYCDTAFTDNTYQQSPNSTLTFDDVAPNATVHRPSLEGNTSAIRLGFNVTDNLLSISCRYEWDQNGTQIVLDTCENTTAAFGLWGDHNFTFIVNDTASNSNTTTIDFTVIEKVNESFEANVVESSTQNFDATLHDLTDLEPTMTLLYNNTAYSSTIIVRNSFNKTYRATLDVGLAGNQSFTRNFNWTMNDTAGHSYQFETNTQSVGQFNIAPTNAGDVNAITCNNTGSVYFANYTFINEDTSARVTNQNLTAYYSARMIGQPVNSNVNFTWVENHTSASTYPHCIFPTNVNAIADVKLIYGDGAFAAREFNLQDQIFNGTTVQLFSLFLEEDADTTTITVTVQDTVGNKLVGFLVKAIRFNFGNTSLINVVDSQVTDKDGVVVFELDTSQYYKFEVWQGGDLKHTAGPLILKDTTLTLTVDLKKIFQVGIGATIREKVITTLNYSLSTGNITGTFQDPEDLTSEVRLEAYNSSIGTQNATLIRNSSASIDTLIIHIGNGTNGTGNILWVAKMVAVSNVNNHDYTLRTLDIDLRDTFSLLGTEALLWGGVIATSTIALLAVPSASAVILTGVFTMGILGYVLNIFSLGLTITTLMIGVGLLYVFYMRD